MATSQIGALPYDYQALEWADRQDVLGKLARPSLKQVFDATALALKSIDEVMPALRAVDTELASDTLSPTSREQLRLLKGCMAWRGYILAERELGQIDIRRAMSGVAPLFGYRTQPAPPSDYEKKLKKMSNYLEEVWRATTSAE